MWHENAQDRGSSRAGFEGLADQGLTFLRNRTAEHWLMFAAGLVLGLILG